MAYPTKPERRLFGAFSILPNIVIPFLDEGEKVILVVRQHPITQLAWVMNTVFLIAIIILIEQLFAIFFSVSTPFLVNLFLFGLVLFYVYFSITNWIFNIGVLTTKRIIDLDVQGIINTTTTSTRLEQVQEVNIKSGGIFAGFFHYGTVFVLTASIEKNIEFDSIPFPQEVIDLIDECKHMLLKKPTP